MDYSVFSFLGVGFIFTAHFFLGSNYRDLRNDDDDHMIWHFYFLVFPLLLCMSQNKIENRVPKICDSVGFTYSKKKLVLLFTIEFFVSISDSIDYLDLFHFYLV